MPNALRIHAAHVILTADHLILAGNKLLTNPDLAPQLAREIARLADELHQLAQLIREKEQTETPR